VEDAGAASFRERGAGARVKRAERPPAMPFETLQCASCGAIPKDTGTKFCGFCGALLPLRTPGPATPVEAPERFEAVERHPELPKLLARVPDDPGAPSVLPGSCFLALLAAVTIGMLTQMGHGPGGGLPPAILLAPALMSLLAIGMIVSAARSRSAPLHRNVAVVLDERIKVSGGGQHSHARTEYYVLLADRSGTRVELEATEELAGSTAPGDIGVAYIRRGRLVDFTIVRA
jgi:hypothetical protein